MEFDEGSFVGNKDIHDLLAFSLQQAVEACIDIATHIISGMNLPRKETAKDVFLLLVQNRVIDLELALIMGKVADFRNGVVHGYNNFDYSLLFKRYRSGVGDLGRFGEQIVEFLEIQSVQ